MNPSHSVNVEALEPRRLFSQLAIVGGLPRLPIELPATLPFVKRGYSGDLIDGSGAALVRMGIRKQQLRGDGSSASLRGAFTALGSDFGEISGQIVACKVRIEKGRVSLTLQATRNGERFTGTFIGKAYYSGEVVKGTFTLKSATTKIVGPIRFRDQWPARFANGATLQPGRVLGPLSGSGISAISNLIFTGTAVTAPVG